MYQGSTLLKTNSRLLRLLHNTRQWLTVLILRNLAKGAKKNRHPVPGAMGQSYAHKRFICLSIVANCCKRDPITVKANVDLH